jgi:hypothetical protein
MKTLGKFGVIALVVLVLGLIIWQHNRLTALEAAHTEVASQSTATISNTQEAPATQTPFIITATETAIPVVTATPDRRYTNEIDIRLFWGEEEVNASLRTSTSRTDGDDRFAEIVWPDGQTVSAFHNSCFAQVKAGSAALLYNTEGAVVTSIGAANGLFTTGNFVDMTFVDEEGEVVSQSEGLALRNMETGEILYAQHRDWFNLFGPEVGGTCNNTVFTDKMTFELN